MMIQFCEFCSSVIREETDRCTVCGCHLAQSVDEETFNNPEYPWPFKPVADITLRIQGQPRKIHFQSSRNSSKVPSLHLSHMAWTNWERSNLFNPLKRVFSKSFMALSFRIFLQG